MQFSVLYIYISSIYAVDPIRTVNLDLKRITIDEYVFGAASYIFFRNQLGDAASKYVQINKNQLLSFWYYQQPAKLLSDLQLPESLQPCTTRL